MTIDLRDPAYRADPDPYLDLKREEAAVHVDPFGTHVVLRHAEVAALLRDPRLGKDLRRWRGYGVVRPYGPGTTFERYVESWMSSRDAPDHLRLRRLASQAFTPRAVAMMGSAVEDIAQSLVARLPERGEVELVAAFARPFPVRVVSRILGFPASDHRDLVRWSSGLALAVELQPKRYAEAELAATGMEAYVRRAIEARRAHPSDDLLTSLVEARDWGELLSDDELVAMVMLLFVAAHETTTGVLGVGLLALLEAPAELARLRAHPELVPRAIDELLRVSTPGPFSARATSEAVTVGDTVIPAGSLVLLGLATANRDPRAFVAPERLDVGRAVNPHVAFGAGPHFCLGAALARLEIATALELLLARWATIVISDEAPPRWAKRSGMRRLDALTLTVEPRARTRVTTARFAARAR